MILIIIKRLLYKQFASSEALCVGEQGGGIKSDSPSLTKNEGRKMDLVLITTYIERRQDDELCRLAEELKEAKIKKSELLRACLALGLDAVRELVPEVLAELRGGGIKSDSPSPLKMGMYY